MAAQVQKCMPGFELALPCVPCCSADITGQTFAIDGGEWEVLRASHSSLQLAASRQGVWSG